MSLFAGLKEKFADKLAEFKSTATPADPADKHALDLVEAATSDELIAPDWSLNFNVVDFVNNDVSHNTGRALKAIKRSLAKPNTKVQLLSLTLLEGCVKNCPIEFHGHLAASDLWADVVKLAEDTSITRVDAEVRDRVLGMVEDFSRLQPTQFQAVYGSLLDRGMDFPIRAQNESVPLITPPVASAGAAVGAQQESATVGPAQADGSAVSHMAANAGDAATVEPTATGAGEADPLAGVDEQDRAAIQAALAELEAEARAAQEAARIAAEADAVELRQRQLLQQQQQQAQLLLAQQQQPHEQQQQQAAMEAEAALGLLAAAQTAEAAAAAETAAATATATAAAGGAAFGVAVPATYIPHQRQQLPLGDSGVAGGHPEQTQAGVAQGPAEPVEERVAKLLETANNTTLLLSEMLASVPDSEPVIVREPYIAEIAETCVRLRSRLERDLVTLSDEALLASALSQHEELSRVLLRYDELLAAAEAVAPTVPRNAVAVALSHAAASRGVSAATADAGGNPHPPPPMLQRQTLLHQQQQGQQQHPAAGTETAGQKMAAVAAALKERFTGAFDKLVAAAAAARAPGALLPSIGAPAAGAVGYAALAAGGGSGGASPSGAAAGPGAFTLLDDEEEETNEGTALIAKRTGQPNAEAQLASLPAQDQQQQMEQLVHAATGAVPPQWVSLPQQQPPATAAAGPDLISFDDEAPPQSPAAEASPAPVSEQQRVAAIPPSVAIGVTLSGIGDLNDLLSGLSVHALVDAAGTATVTPPAVEPPAPLQPPAAAISREDSVGRDQLVEALDRLVSQSGDTALPDGEALVAMADVGAGEPSGAAPALQQESQLHQ